jgi:AraC family transcriptional regulator of adaptative response/methylated-DNA-[protein]-cysteine methyltransferase
VKTTGIYCRPSCSARIPKRENVEFFDTGGQATQAGYRACKRCHPDTLSVGPG